MMKRTTAAAAALAFLILLISCLALGLGLATSQPHGPLFWGVTAGFAVQALGSAAWLARLIVRGLADVATDGATNRGTGRSCAD